MLKYWFLLQTFLPLSRWIKYVDLKLTDSIHHVNIFINNLGLGIPFGCFDSLSLIIAQ